MADKKWQLPVGSRGASEVDSVGEIQKRHVMERDDKKMNRTDEIEELEHRARVKELTTAPSPEKEPLVQIDPIKLDIQGGEKAARERADKAEETVAKERDRRAGLQDELGKERLERLEGGFKTQVNDLKKMLEEKKDEKTITEKLDEIKDTATTLGWGPQQTSSQIPAGTQIQLQQMSNDMQLRLAEMAADQSRRDKEWTLTVRKWDDEKELRRQEVNQKAAGDAERLQFMKGTVNTFGKIIGQSFMEEGGVAATAQQKQFTIEAAVGEEGDVECPGCKTSMFLPPDANDLICPSCGSIGKVVRKAAAKGKADK